MLHTFGWVTLLRGNYSYVNDIGNDSIEVINCYTDTMLSTWNLYPYRPLTWLMHYRLRPLCLHIPDSTLCPYNCFLHALKLVNTSMAVSAVTSVVYFSGCLRKHRT